MSNSQLKSEVSRLETDLRLVVNENNELQNEVNIAVNGVVNAERDLNVYNQTIRSALDDATGVIDYSTAQAISAYELQGQIDHLYIRYKSIELANKRIRALNNKKYYDFNNFRTVRKIVRGLMDNLDLSMVNESVIYKSVEKQHLVTPDFWLTPALISIMAWKLDDKLLADRALGAALKLDYKNSCIFYMIFNLRMNREQSAVKWFLEYQKCELKNSDENTFLMLFSVISKTMVDNVDSETTHIVQDFISNLIEQCAEREGYCEDEIISLIIKQLQRLIELESFDFALMAKYCSDYSTIVQMLNLAGNNRNILELILRIANVQISEKNTYLKEFLNELLAKPNACEMETYDEIEYNELVIKMGGDAENARKEFDKNKNTRETELNIISSIIGWIYNTNQDEVNAQMRMNMFVLVRSYHEKSVELYFRSYRSMFTNIHPVHILDYSNNVDFTNKAESAKGVEEFYAVRQKKELSEIKNIIAFMVLGMGLLAGAAAFFVNLILLAGLGIGLSVGAGMLLLNKFKRKNVILNIQKQKESVLDILQKMFDENEKINDLYKEYDNVSIKITHELAKL